MRIAVNTRLLLSGKLDGIGWFTFHTLDRITRANPGVEFIFLFDRPWSEEFIFGSNVTPVALFPQARHPFLYYLWFEYAIPRALKKYRADLFLSPDGYLSLSTKVPQVAVIHDLNFEHYPKDLPPLAQWYYRFYFPRFAKKAARIATVSEFSKSDIVNCYHLAASKIDVVYNGVNEIYRPFEETEKIPVREKYASGKSYFLFVGMLHQRKNIANLLRAFDYFRKQSGSEMKLLIVGHKKWWTTEMETVLNNMTYKKDVEFTGRLAIEELSQVMAAASVMMYVSFFEGFGVPVIEAMRCGVPVITSNVSSMPEISGGAAYLADPSDVVSIGDAMIRVTNDKALAESLIRKGIEQSRKFSWNVTADKLWQTIIKTLEVNPKNPVDRD